MRKRKKRWRAKEEINAEWFVYLKTGIKREMGEGKEEQEEEEEEEEQEEEQEEIWAKVAREVILVFAVVHRSFGLLKTVQCFPLNKQKRARERNRARTNNAEDVVAHDVMTRATSRPRAVCGKRYPLPCFINIGDG